MLRTGDTFDRYTIEAPIGSGGMGAVYRARDNKLDRRVALKVIADGAPRSPEGDARFVREARAAAALDHPNVVSIFDTGEFEGTPFIVMELVSGQTLRELASTTVSTSQCVAWLVDVGRALAAAHRRGLVHRDVKPDNVMVRDDGVVKVLDFGIARRSSSGAVDGTAPTQAPSLPALTREGTQVGTPVYMAPEQIRGDDLDGRTDQFAWGVLAYELLTGRLPWRGAEPFAVVASILSDDISEADLERAGASTAVASVVRKALSKKPADRFASMDDLLRALVPDDAPSASSPAPRVDRVPSSGAGPSTRLERYSTAEVEAILSRAVEQQEAMRPDARLGFDDLVAAAREVGVSPEVLAAASRDLRAAKQPAAIETIQDDGRAAWVLSNRNKFYRHLGSWVLVAVALFILGISEGAHFDHMKVLLIWGVFVGMHGLRALFFDEKEWRKHEARELKRAPAARRSEAPRAPARPEVDEDARLLLKTGAAMRQRITQNAAATPARVRIDGDAHGADREATAEEEARAAAELSVRKQRG